MTLHTDFFPIRRSGMSTDLGQIRISGIPQDKMGNFLAAMNQMGLAFHLGPTSQLDIAPMADGYGLWAISAQGHGVLSYLLEEDGIETCDDSLADLAAAVLDVGSIVRIDGFQEIDPGRFIETRIDISVEDGETYVARHEDAAPTPAF